MDQCKLCGGIDHNVELAAFLHCEAIEDHAIGGNVNGQVFSCYSSDVIWYRMGASRMAEIPFS